MDFVKGVLIGYLVGLIVVAGCVMAMILDTPEEIDVGKDEVAEAIEVIEVIEKYKVRNYSTKMKVIHDNKRNVTCWKLGDGISCIPDHMLNDVRRNNKTLETSAKN